MTIQNQGPKRRRSYRAVVTLQWDFEHDTNNLNVEEKVRQQLNEFAELQILKELKPEFKLSQVKRLRGRIKHLKSFEPDEIQMYFEVLKECYEEQAMIFNVDGEDYSVKMHTKRFRLFRTNRTCVSCGLVGTKMILDLPTDARDAHFNLYGEEDGELILMTQDHILPRSKGGTNEANNIQCMCVICNVLKSDYELGLDECRQLREAYKNEQNLSRKKLTKLINNLRKELADKPSGRTCE